MKTSIKPNRLLTMAGFLILASLDLAAGDLRIIANPSVKTDIISARDLKSVFLSQRKTLPDGSSVVPVLQKSGRIHQAFLKHYLGRGSDELQTYYQGLVFTGKGNMPKQVTSDSEAVAWVAQTKGAIGYVSASAAVQGVKILLVDAEAASQERSLVKRVEPEVVYQFEILFLYGPRGFGAGS